MADNDTAAQVDAATKKRKDKEATKAAAEQAKPGPKPRGSGFLAACPPELEAEIETVVPGSRTARCATPT